MEGTPWIAYTKEDLDKQPYVESGDVFLCPYCDDEHALITANDGGEMLLFFLCDGRRHVGAVANRLIVNLQPHSSGIHSDEGEGH